VPEHLERQWTNKGHKMNTQMLIEDRIFMPNQITDSHISPIKKIPDKDAGTVEDAHNQYRFHYNNTAFTNKARINGMEYKEILPMMCSAFSISFLNSSL
tara:strand:+ start:785 stop:1081 length:297 start_codon:yes stop_codon:yes gene_type:complete